MLMLAIYSDIIILKLFIHVDFSYSLWYRHTKVIHPCWF